MKKFIFLLLVMCCTMCQQGKQQENIFYVNIDNPEKVSLSDYFHSIELTPLETDTNVLVNSIHRLINYQGKYYALDMPQSIVFVFNHDGDFLFKIDKKGKGPGEYNFLEDIHINQYTGLLELLSPYGTVYNYDLSGNFIETKQVAYPGFRAIHSLIAIDKQKHVFYAMFEPKKIIYFDLNNKNLFHEEFDENEGIGGFGFDSFYPYQDEWYFFRPFHLGVYKIGKERLEEAFRLDFGKYTREGTTGVFSNESRQNLKKKGEEAFAQFPYWIRRLGHNNKYVLAQVPWSDANNRSYIIYDKVSQKGRFIPEFTEKVEFEPIIVTDEYVLSWCSWNNLGKHITKEMLVGRQKEIFESIIQSEMETNPILIKYYFE